MTNHELKDVLACVVGSALSKLKLSTQEFTIELERSFAAAPAAPAAVSVPAASAPKAPVGETVTAPLVGTVYAAPTPDQPPFVQVGDRVKKGQPLCLLEAMKMMSEVTAPCDCEITATLKENGALVSFGDGLFSYKPC
mgnify:CR=1 FL=1